MFSVLLSLEAAQDGLHFLLALAGDDDADGVDRRADHAGKRQTQDIAERQQRAPIGRRAAERCGNDDAHDRERRHAEQEARTDAHTGDEEIGRERHDRAERTAREAEQLKQDNAAHDLDAGRDGAVLEHVHGRLLKLVGLVCVLGQTHEQHRKRGVGNDRCARFVAFGEQKARHRERNRRQAGDRRNGNQQVQANALVEQRLCGRLTAVARARDGGKAAAKPLLDQGVRLYLLIAVPAVAGLTAVSLPMSRFLFAKGYEAGAPVIAYTALAMLFMGLTEYANKAYELEQATVHVLQNSAIAACIKVVSSIVLLKLLGFTGGALGSIVAFASYFFITCVRVRSRFLFRVPTLSVVRIIVSAALCGAAAYGCTLLPLGNILRLALACVVGAAVYAVCIIVSGEGKEEMQAVLRRFKR